MGTKITKSGSGKVYTASEAWVEQALRRDGSLFTSGRAIWSSHWLGELHRRFLDHPDETNASFLEKLQVQLEGSPPEVYQLMAEVLYFHFLIVSTKSSANERQVITSPLGWSPSPVTIPQELVEALTPGILNPGQYFHVTRPFQVGFLIEFVEQWKEKEAGDQRRLLANPWDFKDFILGLNFHSALLQDYSHIPRAQREAVLHLVFPDIFEAMVSVDHKDSIARAFSRFVTTPEEDVDRKLQQIRPALEAQHGSEDHLFYKPEIRSQWDDKYEPDLWDEFVRRAQTYVATGRLESEEIEYKVEIGRKLAAAREAVLAGAEDWAVSLKAALNTNDANFINWRQISAYNQWCETQPEEALRTLRAIWTRNESTVSERILAFSDLLPMSVLRGAGTRMNFASALLMGLDVEQYPPFRIRVFNETYDRIAYGRPERGVDEAALYDYALGFLDQFIEEAEKRGLTLRHRLDAQSVVWGIQGDGDGPDDSDEEDSDEPIGGESKVDSGRSTSSADPWTLLNIEALARELLWETGGLQKIVDGLKDKRQAIFQGPPGTGKTYVAKRLAEWCREQGGDFHIVQFHPSYSYEDFVEGFRPTLTENGQAGFKLTWGPLRRIAAQAEANPDATFILVIDEINRGNVAKVLGELYFLLEYRDAKMELQYSNEEFSLPKNLWFIGTMNTTDRSIALVDAALRRRFYFFGFFPDELPVLGLLDRWLEENNSELKWVADLVELANRKLEDRHLGIGPSHFMKKDPPLDEERVQFIWEQAIIPYIEEQCFGDEDKLKNFEYERLKRELAGGAFDIFTGNGLPEGEEYDGNGQPE